MAHARLDGRAGLQPVALVALLLASPARTGASPEEAAPPPSFDASFLLSDVSAVLSHRLPVLVAFTAPWCVHCQALKPTLAALARNASEDAALASRFAVAAVSCESTDRGEAGSVAVSANDAAAAALCAAFGVQSYPTLALLAAGGAATPAVAAARAARYPGGGARTAVSEVAADGAAAAAAAASQGAGRTRTCAAPPPPPPPPTPEVAARSTTSAGGGVCEESQR